tara:strand:- start:775 stop:2064 length:1290 start_codon:yes stop_codon:yes gene_type:complete
MIEILNISFLVFVMIWITSLPIISFFKNKKFLKFFSTIEKNTINLSFLLNFFLIISFFEVNFSLIFYILLFLPLINIFFVSKINLNTQHIVLFFIILILSTSISSALVLEWDAASVWIYRVKNFFYGNSFFNLPNIPGVVSYPHLGTYVWSFFWHNSFFDAEYTGRIFYIFSYSLSILIIINFTKNDFLEKLILTLLLFTISLDYYLLSGYQEYLVFSYLIFIFYFYEKYINYQNIIFLIPVGLFINVIIWIKNEATFFVLFFFLFVCFQHFINKLRARNELIILFFIFIISVSIKYYLFYSFFDVINSGWQGYRINNYSKFIQLNYFFDRSFPIILSIIIALVKCKTYLVFFLVVILLYNKKNNNYIKPFLFFLIINIIFIFLIYYFANDPAWKHYMATTVDRLLFQISGIFLIPITFYLKDLIKFKN